MSTVDRAIEDASRLPLKDAAYFLWVRRLALDHVEHPRPSRPVRSVNLHDPQALMKSVSAAFAKVQGDRASATEGATFVRLKRAHPEAGDHALKSAIRKAVKFAEDCVKFFSLNGGDFAANVANAIDRAKKDNPDFGEQTYELARWELARTMK